MDHGVPDDGCLEGTPLAHWLTLTRQEKREESVTNIDVTFPNFGKKPLLSGVVAFFGPFLRPLFHGHIVTRRYRRSPNSSLRLEYYDISLFLNFRVAEVNLRNQALEYYLPLFFWLRINRGLWRP
jgi:hypothetical protein